MEYALREKGSEIWEPLTGNREPLETGEYFKSSINNPKIWDVEHPFCYELAVTLKKDQRNFAKSGNSKQLDFELWTFLRKQVFL